MSGQKFTFNGGVEEHEGKWNAIVVLDTPDGKQTKIDSGFIFSSKEEAEFNMTAKLNEILSSFTKDYGVEVLSKNGMSYQ